MKIILASVLSLMMIIPAFADGDDVMRPLAASEKAWMTSTMKSILAALPAAPKDWKRKDDTGTPRKEVSASARYPLSMSTRTDYEKPVTMTTEEMSRNAEDVSQSMEKMGPIMEKMNAAAAKGDQKEMQRLQAELMKLQSGSSGMQNMKAKSEEAEMQRLSIDVSINANGYDIDGVKEIAAPSGVSVALRGDLSTRAEYQKDMKDTRITLFFGNFTKKGGPNAFEIYCKQPAGMYTKVNSVIVTIVARDGKLAEEYLTKINSKAIAALLR
ncbi:MAG: hypothetical protein AABZ39_06215 [Spirochaetota bacterium]